MGAGLDEVVERTQWELYAVTDTSAPVVLRQGFTRYGRMTYWERPAETD